MKTLKTIIIFISLLLPTLAASAQESSYPANYARAPRFKALLYYSDTAEEAHVQFANQAIDFFNRLTYGEGFILETTTTLEGYSYERLSD